MAEVPAPARRPLRFSSFELDLQSGELRKAGVLVGLQEQSFKVLAELLDRPGDLVTRDQLRQLLWPNGTFVDFEHGLNAVINRLRETLGDSADSPRFIQTVPRRGYRFIAPVEGAVDAAHGRPAPRSAVDDRPTNQTAALPRRIGNATAIAVASLIVLVGAIVLFRRPAAIDSPPLRVVPLTRLAGNESWPAFAPDGDQVAFAWSGEKYDNTDIYVTLVGSTDVRRLTTDAAVDFAPAWSPDGRRIAFLRKSGHSARIHVTSALGGSEAKLGDFPVGVPEIEGELIGAQITWSPDGRSIVAGRDPRVETSVPAGLYVIPVDGEAPRPITRPQPPAIDLDPAFSADGRRLAYLSCSSGSGRSQSWLQPDHCAVRMMDVDGSAIPASASRALTTQRVDPSGLAWNRDGTSIIFVNGEPGPFRLWRVGTDQRHHEERIEIAGPFQAVWPAANGSHDRLVFASFQWDVHLYRFNEGRAAEQVAPSSTFEIDPGLSPDGRWMAFVSGRSGNGALWVASADGSNARQVTHDARHYPGSPAWSPDGTVIAFDSMEVDNLSSARIWMVDAEGGAPRQLTTGSGDQTVPTWSRDGKSIYYSSQSQGTRNIWRVRTSRGTAPEPVTRTGSGFVAYEFADGTSLLYQPESADSPLLLMPLTGAAAPRRLVDCVRAAAFAPAGRAIVYVPCASGSNPPLHALDPVSGKDRVLGTLVHFPQGATHVNLAVTPDLKSIVFKGIEPAGGDLMLIEKFR